MSSMHPPFSLVHLFFIKWCKINTCPTLSTVGNTINYEKWCFKCFIFNCVIATALKKYLNHEIDSLMMWSFESHLTLGTMIIQVRGSVAHNLLMYQNLEILSHIYIPGWNNLNFPQPVMPSCLQFQVNQKWLRWPEKSQQGQNQLPSLGF